MHVLIENKVHSIQAMQLHSSTKHKIFSHAHVMYVTPRWSLLYSWSGKNATELFVYDVKYRYKVWLSDEALICTPVAKVQLNRLCMMWMKKSQFYKKVCFSISQGIWFILCIIYSSTQIICTSQLPSRLSPPFTFDNILFTLPKIPAAHKILLLMSISTLR